MSLLPPPLSNSCAFLSLPLSPASSPPNHHTEEFSKSLELNQFCYVSPLQHLFSFHFHHITNNNKREKKKKEEKTQLFPPPTLNCEHFYLVVPSFRTCVPPPHLSIERPAAVVSFF